MRMLCGELSAARHAGAEISSHLRSLEVHQARTLPGAALAHREAPVNPLVKPQEAAAAILKKSLRVLDVMLFSPGSWILGRLVRRARRCSQDNRLSQDCTPFPALAMGKSI